MSDQEFHEKILKEMAEIKLDIKTKLDPIYQTYQAWQTLGRWGKAVLWLVGALLGILIAWKQLITK